MVVKHKPKPKVVAKPVVVHKVVPKPVVDKVVAKPVEHKVVVKKK